MLLEWIDESKLDYCELSSNPHDGAIAMLRENPDKIDWENLSNNTNEDAIAMLRENPDKIHWANLCYNPNEDAIALLKENPDKIHWANLCYNTGDKAIQLLKENRDKWKWSKLSENTNDCVIDFLLDEIAKNPNDRELNNYYLYQRQNFTGKFDWKYLSKDNVSGHIFELFEEDQYLIDWSCNESDIAVDLLLNEIRETPDRMNWVNFGYSFGQNFNKINWQYLCRIPKKKVVDFLQENQDEIDWFNLSANPCIFQNILYTLK
jgi:arsenate reductase-like glutaredoxin family protein